MTAGMHGAGELEERLLDIRWETAVLLRDDGAAGTDERRHERSDMRRPRQQNRAVRRDRRLTGVSYHHCASRAVTLWRSPLIHR